MTEVAGLPVINLTESPLSGVNRVLKSAEDFVLSLCILVLASPAMLLIALGVKLSSKGPAFYRQERVTWNGEHFQMLKYRTMPVDVETGSGPVWADAAARRATPFGAFLHATAGWLPQFLNSARRDVDRPAPRAAGIRRRFKDEVGYMQNTW
jgi:putative colanic acid biosynthesis UDP-glucose lipid carrier transferase